MEDQYQSRINNLNELLANRLAVYPKRDESSVRLNDGLKEFSTYLLKTVDFDGFQPDHLIVEGVERFYDTPIFVCGAMKSGTSLCNRLLDNHPNLLVMPGDSHFINQIERWNRSQFTEIAEYWINRVVNPTGAEPFWFLGPDEKQLKCFLQYLHYFLLHSQYEIYVCVVMSIYAVNATFGQPTVKKYWVEKTPNNEIHAQMLYKRFPRAKFLHVIRDPLNNIAALKKLSDIRQRESSPLQSARFLKRLLQTAKQNQEVLGKDKYHIFKYEQLTSDPEKVLNDICIFLDIPFHENLLKPTENGRTTTANSMFTESRVTGKILDQSHSKRFLQQLSKIEIQDIVTILYREAIEFGYNWASPDIQIYRMSGFYIQLHWATEKTRSIFRKIRSGFS